MQTSSQISSTPSSQIHVLRCHVVGDMTDLANLGPGKKSFAKTRARLSGHMFTVPPTPLIGQRSLQHNKPYANILPHCFYSDDAAIPIDRSMTELLAKSAFATFTPMSQLIPNTDIFNML